MYIYIFYSTKYSIYSLESEHFNKRHFKVAALSCSQNLQWANSNKQYIGLL